MAERTEHVRVDSFGCSVGKKSGRLVVREKGQVIQEVPFFQVEQLTLESRGISISCDAIQECVEHGIQINFLSNGGRPFAKVLSPELTGTVATRREQIFAYNDRRGVDYGKALATAKLGNQINVLKYFAKYRKTSNWALYEELHSLVGRIEGIKREIGQVDGERIDDVRFTLLSIEGRAAQPYWQGVGLLLGDKVDFPGRQHQGADDPVNSMLNYGYGILYHQVWGAIILAGLEPFAGFLHVDRPGKPSLVLDLVEEFRQQVVDRTVLAMAGKGFLPGMEEGKLDQPTRQELARRINERLEDRERYETKKFMLKSIIQSQARHLATFLRGEGKYRPYIGSW